MKRLVITLGVLLTGIISLVFSWSDKKSEGKSAAQGTDASGRTALVALEKPARDSSEVGIKARAQLNSPSEGDGSDFRESGAYLIPWEDTTVFSNPLSGDSLQAALEEFRKSQAGFDTLAGGPEADSIGNFFQENLDFRDCGGSGNYSTLDNLDMQEDLLFASAPKPGFSYRIAGKGGKLQPGD